MVIQSQSPNKKWYLSKTLWVNTISFVAGVLQIRYGWVVDPQYQVEALGVINFLLRLVTHTNTVW